MPGNRVLWLAAAALSVVGWGALAAPPPAAGEEQIDWGRARQHWAFRAPQAHRPPAVRQKDWPRQPLDTFILARLEQRRLSPSPEADPRTLIRRVTYDLTGLPPTPEEVAAFAAECDAEGAKGKGQRAKGSGVRGSLPSALSSLPDRAYERLIGRLLASPRFGERMASMWLPLARYGEDQAHQVGSDTKFFYPNAHLYRQWVIDAFNRDLPYDRFVRLQLAADLLVDETGKSGNPQAIAAASIPQSSGSQPPNSSVPPSDIAALGFLGLGPKYYNRNRLDVMADEWQDRVDTVTRTFLGLTVACARCHDHKYDPITQQDYYGLAGVFASVKMVNRAPDGTVEAGTTEAAKMRKDTMHVVEDDAPHDLNVFLRGDVNNKGPMAPRRFLKVLSSGEPEPFHAGSGRKELAAAIASPGNPLTARVMVNRLWGLFFGTPLVGTPSNFGLIGDLPTHPELLDDLAVRFARTWSIKSVVREIVLSSTYWQASSWSAERGAWSVRRQASGVKNAHLVSRGLTPKTQGPTPNAVDPTNALLWRMNRRRLTVEQWRDGVLFVTGALEPGGGPSQELTDPANHKRTLYARVSRLKLNDMLMQFDYPDANVHAEKRSVTTTPMQKLFLLNSPFILEQARALATRLTSDPSETNVARVQRAYLTLYNRPPTPEETQIALEFLQKPETEGMPRWERYAQVLLASNEMFYID